MNVELSDELVALLQRPVNGRGGFQNLLRKLQGQLSGNVLTVTEQDVERMVRYSLSYGEGGFQGRLAGPAEGANE